MRSVPAFRRSPWWSAFASIGLLAVVGAALWPLPETSGLKQSSEGASQAFASGEISHIPAKRAVIRQTNDPWWASPDDTQSPESLLAGPWSENRPVGSSSPVRRSYYQHPARPVAFNQLEAPSTDEAATAPTGDGQPPPVPPPPPTPAVERLEQVPVGDPAVNDRIKITSHSDLLSLTARDAPLDAVLGLIAKQHGLNIIAGDQVSQRVTVTLTDVRLSDALDTLLAVNGYAWSMQRNILIISPLEGAKKLGPMVQGRVVRVFPLNYVAAADVDKVVKGLLSPVGQSFIVETSPADQRRTHEQIVVEDMPYYVDRIAQYVYGVDFQPRQVVVEAHVLQVSLKDDCKHGVDFEQILRIANSEVALQMQGFASDAASPAGLLKINGTDLTAVVEALKTTTDAKTLASPKVAVLNGQEARIQVGGQIGYLTTTTTETSAVQTVNFLDTGVILVVTPIITADRQILMSVKPQVSSGRINDTTGLPESETTEVETKVMLADGEAVVIGGLIKEIDTEVQNKIPWLGDLKYVGRLFQRRSINQERSEVIIALLPRIVTDAPGCREVNPADIQQVRTPLFIGGLNRVDRRAWEATLPDATDNPPRYCPPAPVEYGPPPFCEPQPQPPVYGPVQSPMPYGVEQLPAPAIEPVPAMRLPPVAPTP